MAKDTKLQRDFGQILRLERERKGISQEKLALDCGLDRTFISLLERGLRQPSLSTIYAISKSLNTTGSCLLSKLEDLYKKGG